VDGSTGSKGHVNSAVSQVTSRTPTPIIGQRSVNTPLREAVLAASPVVSATPCSDYSPAITSSAPFLRLFAPNK
jgi:hypothetical protein